MAVTLSLRRCHGDTPSQLQPLDLRGASPADVAADAFPDAGVQGVRCCAAGNELRASREGCMPQGEHEMCSIPLFLTQVFHAIVCSVFQLVMVPKLGGASLKDMLGVAPAWEGLGWCAWSGEVEDSHDILDYLRESGCLMDDFDNVYGRLNQEGTQVYESRNVTVHRVEHRLGTFTAVKRPRAGADIDAIEAEVGVLLAVKGHEHVAQFRGLFRVWEGGAATVALCSEFMLFGDLLRTVLSDGQFGEVPACRIFQSVVAALFHVHSVGVIHRDVKPENIMFKRPGIPVLTGFNLACMLSNEVEMARRCGTPGYLAPEVCRSKPYGPKVDMFGAGVVLHFMLSKELPFGRPFDDKIETMKKTSKCNLNLRQAPFTGLSSHANDMLRALICKKPEDRLSSHAALGHHWFQMHAPSTASKSGRSTRSTGPRSVHSMASIPEDHVLKEH